MHQARPYLLPLYALLFACAAEARHPKPAADAADKYDCVVSQSTRRAFPMTNARWRVTWNERTRVKARLASEAPDAEMRFAWRYDADGRLLAYAGFGPGQYDNFQHNYAYDKHDHVVDAYASSPPHPDLEVPPAMDTDTGTTYANEYNAAGQLVASTLTPRGEAAINPRRYEFGHDANGRCEHIALTGRALESTETRSYDDAGRLQTSELEYSRPVGANMSCPERITIHEYDKLGRITRSRTHCRDTPTLDALLETHTYASDGSETIETFDYTDDVVNDSVTIDGVEYHFAHSKEQRTAGCAAIETAIAAPTDNICRVP